MPRGKTPPFEKGGPGNRPDERSAARVPRENSRPGKTPPFEKGGPGGISRRLAWDVLVAVEGGAFADAELNHRLENTALERRDQALATRLVYGTLAWQGYLDHIIGQCGRPASQLDEPVRCLLRLALFQLTKLDRVPDFAAVNTAVELSKSFKGGSATGLVNAVLRRFLRERERLMQPPAAADPAERLAASFSHPRWLVAMWMEGLGAAETEALLAADNEAAPTVLRVNRTRAGRERVLDALKAAGVDCQPTRYSPDGIELLEGAAAPLLPGFREGLFSVQGEASQLVTALIGIAPGKRVLDACAAPGGKATHLAERMDGQGTVVAIDANQRGLAQLRGSATRLGLANLQPICADLFAAIAAQEPFDAVLLDAPCSGLGTLRQHPEIRWRRDTAGIAEVAQLQARMLEAVAPSLRPGGALVYSTCTISRRENDAVIANFLATHPEFAMTPAAAFLPPEAAALADAEGFFRTFPHRDGLDGFFAARLERRR